MECEEIVKRADHLKSERKGTVEQVWDLIERFVVPLRGDFYVSLNSEGEVDWHRRDIFDSTAVFAAQSLAASLHGNLTSPSQRWFELRFRDDELNENDAAKEWLDECTSRLYGALNESNFDIEIAEAYTDLVAFGTTVITEEVEDDDELLFSAVPCREMYFEEDHKKDISCLYRMLKWTPKQILSKFGEEGVPDKIKQAAEKPEGGVMREEVIFCVYPRDVEIDTTKPAAPTARPYGYKFVLKSPVTMLGEEGGYYEMPAFVARWRKVAGSRWGHSPATIALADILQLNQVVEATLEAASKAIDPPTLAETNALQGNLDLERGGMTIVNDINALRPYESGSRFDVSNLETARLQESIRKAFYQDQLELKESPAMTATEVNVRYELMQRLLGPTLGRLKSDLLDPMIERSFKIMMRAGLLPEMPENLGGADLDIEYLGPLARAQRSDAAQAIEMWMAGLAQLAEFYPQTLDLVDQDQAVREIAKLRGVPAAAIRSEDEIAQKRQMDAERQQAMAMTQQIQEAGAAAEAVGKGGQALQAVGDMSGAA